MKGGFSMLVLHEGTALYSRPHKRFVEVAVRAYFAAYGRRFLVVRDPFDLEWYTVIEEETGRRLVEDFSYRSVGIAFDKAKRVIYENKDRLFRIDLLTALAERTLKYRNRGSISPAIFSLLWK